MRVVVQRREVVASALLLEQKMMVLMTMKTRCDGRRANREAYFAQEGIQNGWMAFLTRPKLLANS